jgi:hypothetical protein
MILSCAIAIISLSLIANWFYEFPSIRIIERSIMKSWKLKSAASLSCITARLVSVVGFSSLLLAGTAQAQTTAAKPAEKDSVVSVEVTG